MSFLLGFLLFLNAYLLGIYALNKTGRLGGRAQLAGPFLLLKTQRGTKTIERIARARRLWLVFGDVGIWATWIAGILVFLLLIYQLWNFITDPVTVAANSPSAQYLIGLPGVNPLIPVWYGIFGLVVALVVHEGCHGILARAQDLKVKSLGLLLFIVPVGAFVEPDERDLERATAKQKNRVFAAGPMSNLVLALVTAALFAGPLMGSASVVNDAEGVGLISVGPDMPAGAAGLAAGDVVVAMNGIPVRDLEDFNRILNSTRAGQTLTMEYLRDGERGTATATLADKFQAYEENNPPEIIPTWFRGKGFLGVGPTALKPEPCTQAAARVGACPEGALTPGGIVDALQNPTDSTRNFAVFISYPFFVLGGLDVFQAPYGSFVEYGGGTFAATNFGGFVIAANTLYWLFWLNLMLGTFNALPAGPLDGGQMFRTTLRDRLLRYYKVDKDRMGYEVEPGQLVELDSFDRDDNMVSGTGTRLTLRGKDPETQAKLDRVDAVVKRATWSLGLFILAMLLLPILARSLVPLLLG